MPIRDLARSDVVTAEPNASAASLAETLRDNNVGSVVIESDGAPTGIVTDRDLAMEVLAGGRDASEVSARDIMTEDLVTVDATEGAFDACSRMCDEGVRRLPLVEDGDLVGIITFDDMLQLLGDELQHLASIAAHESPPY
ncbi:MAG: CBS domain-containing protein [Halanaeroarchaeum sp.]